MPKSLERQSALKNLKVAAPCDVDWDDMTGDERSRFCGSCQLSVFNLSSMTRAEAEAFLSQRVPGQRVCGRFFQRADGTLITDDCPRGLRRLRDAWRLCLKRIGAAASLVIALLPASARAQQTEAKDRGPTVIDSVTRVVPRKKSKLDSALKKSKLQIMDSALPPVMGLIMPQRPVPQRQPIDIRGDISLPHTNTGTGVNTSAPPVPAKHPEGGDPEGAVLSVSARVVSPDADWYGKHREATTSAIWSLRSASLNWQVNAGMLESARAKFHQSAQKAEAENLCLQSVLSLSNEGNCLYYQGNSKQAAECYEKALRYLEEPQFHSKPRLQEQIAANLVQARKLEKESPSSGAVSSRREFLPYLGGADDANISWLENENGESQKTCALRDRQ